MLGGQVLVFGGGTTISTDAVQALPAPGGAIAAGTTAHQVGRLPTVRSDLSAVTIGGRAYVLGGYDGSEPIDSVLQTTDDSTFVQVATLPAPARRLRPAGPKRGHTDPPVYGLSLSGSGSPAAAKFRYMRGLFHSGGGIRTTTPAAHCDGDLAGPRDSITLDTGTGQAGSMAVSAGPGSNSALNGQFRANSPQSKVAR